MNSYHIIFDLNAEPTKWNDREAQYNSSKQPHFYDREAMGKPFFIATTLLGCTFAAAAIAAPITFGASMALPAVGLVIAALVTLVATVMLQGNGYKYTDPKVIVQLERKVVQSLETTEDLIAGIKELKDSGSEFTDDNLYNYFLMRHPLEELPQKDFDRIIAMKIYFIEESKTRLESEQNLRKR